MFMWYIAMAKKNLEHFSRRITRNKMWYNYVGITDNITRIKTHKSTTQTMVSLQFLKYKMKLFALSNRFCFY